MGVSVMLKWLSLRNTLPLPGRLSLNFICRESRLIHISRINGDELKKFAFLPISPPSTVEQRLAQKVFGSDSVYFVKSANKLEDAPQNSKLEVAFVGRSNVGKSTLINAIVNRKNLVKTSNKPGHTRTMNFFSVGDRLVLCDLPGYGFRSREEWGEMILHYFKDRPQLRRIYILVDSRHGLKDSDKSLLELLGNEGLSYQVVLTKTDKTSSSSLGAMRNEVQGWLENQENGVCCFPELLAVNAKDRTGIRELQVSILRACGIHN
ncbi:uncharacterized protein VTP21DRAFT_3939 [Calcarisporiella thermophila]|uniref:uncharacterized protein n=1 Tax=Calcarisporiella thermophila TaxID=911321 RepID=UPI0037431B56